MMAVVPSTAVRVDQRQTDVGELGRVESEAHRRLLLAADRHQADAGHVSTTEVAGLFSSDVAGVDQRQPEHAGDRRGDDGVAELHLVAVEGRLGGGDRAPELGDERLLGGDLLERDHAAFRNMTWPSASSSMETSLVSAVAATSGTRGGGGVATPVLDPRDEDRARHDRHLGDERQPSAQAHATGPSSALPDPSIRRRASGTGFTRHGGDPPPAPTTHQTFPAIVARTPPASHILRRRAIALVADVGARSGAMENGRVAFNAASGGVGAIRRRRVVVIVQRQPLSIMH